MKITDIYTFKDVLKRGPFEGEPLYNKALKYKRYDICLKIADFKRDIVEFEENVRKYEETNLQLYKDKATGRYYHILLWDEIVRRLREEWDEIVRRLREEWYDLTELKERIIDELGLPKPYQFYCFACTAHCSICPIIERAGLCSCTGSAYWNFIDAIDNRDREAAIKYAEVIADAWTE